MTLPAQGGCACGSIRYELTAAPLSSAYCHCRMCQRAAGAALVPWIAVPKESFSLIQGELKTRQSSAWAERSFCPECGTQITFWNENHPNTLDITLASLDDPDLYPPQDQIFAESRPHFLKEFDQELPVRTYNQNG